MKKVAIYLAPYHSQPGLHLEGSSGHFRVVEEAIADGEWPYDNGDDPAFYVARRGGNLTWGVCRQQVRNAIEVGSIVVFFSFTRKDQRIRYRLSAVATVEDKLDREAAFRDKRLKTHRGLYLNLLVRPEGEGWRHDEGHRPGGAVHKDWLWRIAEHGRSKKAFEKRYKKSWRAGWVDGSEPEFARNYVVFSGASEKTYMSRRAPEVAVAVKGQHEKWSDQELRRLTVGKAGEVLRNGRDYLRVVNSSGRNVHPVIRFKLAPEEAREWRRELIAAVKRREKEKAPQG